MPRRNTMALLSLMAGAAVACNDDSPEPGGPSPAPEVQASTAVTYTIKKLNTLGGLQSRAFAINSNTQIVGTSQNAAGRFRAFIWQSGVMKDLGSLARITSEANDINDAGAVVGYSTTLAGAERAVRWQNGVIKNLGTLGGQNSRATAINNDGVIVGWSDTKAGTTHAFVYKNGVMADIGTLGGTESRAWGINDVGKVVGSGTTASGTSTRSSGLTARSRRQWRSGEAIAINDGRISGTLAPPAGTGGDRDVNDPRISAGGEPTSPRGRRRPPRYSRDNNGGRRGTGRQMIQRSVDSPEALDRLAKVTLMRPSAAGSRRARSSATARRPTGPRRCSGGRRVSTVDWVLLLPIGPALGQLHCSPRQG